jgi:hypothetical protein
MLELSWEAIKLVSSDVRPMQMEIENKQFRTFGLMLGGVFAVIGLWPALFRAADSRLWALALAGLLLVLALAVPRGLEPIHRVWMVVGYALGWINTRILLSLIFYALFTPLGKIRCLLGADPMQRKFKPGVDTYRIVRQPRSSSHMKRQF